MNTNTQIFFNSFAAGRTDLTCVSRIDCSHDSISIFSFILRVLNSLIPSDITNCFCKTMIFHHSFDIQIFKENSVVGIDKKSRNLMSKIRTTVFDSIVNLRNYLSFFVPVFASFRLFAQSSLSRCENLLGVSKGSRIINFNTIRQCAESFQTDINSNAFVNRFKNFTSRFNRETSKPFPAGIFRNCESFDFADYFTVKFNFNFSDFREIDFSVRHRKSKLFVGERVISEFVLKSWKTGFFFPFCTAKEILKRAVNSFENVLQNLRINQIQIFSNRFNFRQLFFLVLIGNVYSIKFPRITSLLQSRIIQLSAQTQSHLKFSDLRSTRIKTELKSFSYNGISHLLLSRSKVNRLGSFGDSSPRSTCFYFTTNSTNTTNLIRLPKRNLRLISPRLENGGFTPL